MWRPTTTARKLRPRVLLVAALVLMIGLTGAATPAAAGGWFQELIEAYRGSAAYHATQLAERDGYGPFPPGVPLHECITSPDGMWAMGIHWVNELEAGDAVLSAAEPEVLVYEPMSSGRLRLVALEYVVFADVWEAEHPGTVPSLFGRELTLVPDGNSYEIPAFYQIHAWIWKHNPHGLFADHNPRVSCEFAP